MIFYYTNNQDELLKEVTEKYEDVDALGEFKYKLVSIASYFKIVNIDSQDDDVEKYNTIIFINFKTSSELTKMLNNDILMLKCEDSIENASFSVNGDTTTLRLTAENLFDAANLIETTFKQFLMSTISISIVTEIPCSSEQDEEMIYTRKFADLFIQSSANTDTKIHITKNAVYSNDEFYMLLAVLMTKYLNILTPKKIYLAFSLDYGHLIDNLSKITGIVYTREQIDEIIIQN